MDAVIYVALWPFLHAKKGVRALVNKLCPTRTEEEESPTKEEDRLTEEVKGPTEKKEDGPTEKKEDGLTEKKEDRPTNKEQYRPTVGVHGPTYGDDDCCCCFLKSCGAGVPTGSIIYRVI